MTDLIERLRKEAYPAAYAHEFLMAEAADEIERLVGYLMVISAEHTSGSLVYRDRLEAADKITRSALSPYEDSPLAHESTDEIRTTLSLSEKSND